MQLATYPINSLCLQFAVGSVIAMAMWLFRIVKLPKISFEQVRGLVNVAYRRLSASWVHAGA